MPSPVDRYRFHVHRLVPAWRLVLPAEREPPAEMIAQDWAFTREREAVDTNPDVRAVCAERGFCLFKIGGDFAEVARDVAAADAG